MRVNLNYVLFDSNGDNLTVKHDKTDEDLPFTSGYMLKRATYQAAFQENTTDESLKAFDLHMKLRACSETFIDLSRDECVLAMKCVKMLWPITGFLGQIDYLLEGKDLTGKVSEQV